MSEIGSCANSLTCYRGEAAANLLNIFNQISCSWGANGLRTFFSSGVLKERSLLFGVEVGGGESKNPRLSFVSLTADHCDRAQSHHRISYKTAEPLALPIRKQKNFSNFADHFPSSAHNQESSNKDHPRTPKRRKKLSAA